jgi:hypothetical protein
MKDSKGTKREEYPDEDEEFMRKVVMSEEQRRRYYPHLKWAPGQYRWFEATNIVDLWRYWRHYSARERAAIYQRLRLRSGK